MRSSCVRRQKADTLMRSGAFRIASRLYAVLLPYFFHLACGKPKPTGNPPTFSYAGATAHLVPFLGCV